MRACLGLLALVVCVCHALTAEELKRVIPASAAVHVDTGKPIFLEVEGPDSATDAEFRGVEDEDGPQVKVDLPYLDWSQRKPKFLPAYRAMADGDFGKKDPQVDVLSFNLADPAASIQRECPRRRCPAKVKCSDPTHHCCEAGGFKFCCPAGSTCLNSAVPMCLQEPADDPNACNEEFCKPDFHCPLSQVGSCCLGGETCCPYNSKCTGTTPPTCQALSAWERLNKRQLGPQQVIKMLPGQELAFSRTPLDLVPENVTAPTTPVPTLVPNPTPKPTNASGPSEPNVTLTPLKVPDALPCPECEKSLFTEAPTGVGERTKQKAFLVPFQGRNFRIVITEVQKTTRVRGGGLRTVTRRTRSTTELSAANANLWGSLSGRDIAKSFERVHVARDAGLDGVRRLRDEAIVEEGAKRKWKEGMARRKVQKQQIDEAIKTGRKNLACNCKTTKRPCKCSQDSPEVAKMKAEAVTGQLKRMADDRAKRARPSSSKK